MERFAPFSGYLKQHYERKTLTYLQLLEII